MKPRKFLTKQQAMIEASKFYLAEPFPEELANLPLAQVLAFIYTVRFDFLDSLKAEEVFEEIEALAETFLRLASDYAYGEGVEGSIEKES